MKFSIGEFSKITKLTVKALRLYHDKGILLPSEIDPTTNYRYYSEKDIDRASQVKVLRELNFSISEIRELLNSENDERDLIKILAIKFNENRDKENHYKKAAHSIEEAIKQIQDSQMDINISTQVEEKILNPVLIAGYRMKGKYSDVGQGFKILGRKFGSKVSGKPMNLYHENEYKETNADFEPCVPISKGESSENISVRELKGGKCISLIHKGPYEKLSNSYKVIFNYLNEKQYKSMLPTREVYHKGPGIIFKGNPENYVTEIQILIEE